MTAVDLDLVTIAAEAAVQRALTHTIVPQYRYGTLVDPNAHADRIHAVQIDGDDESSACHDITTGYPLPIGCRVAVMFAPPHQAIIIGAVTPLGPVAQFVSTSNGSLISVSGVTDMVTNNVPLIGGQTYEVHLHVLVEFSSVNADARWRLEFRVDTVNTDRFWDIHPRVTGVSHWLVDHAITYTPDVTGEYDLTVFATEDTDGATLLFQADATARRTLTVYPVGVLPTT